MSQDNLRDGWDPTATGLSPAVVQSSSFGKLPGFPVKLNGQVYAQPLVVGSTIIVATENDQVYGINGTNGKILWHNSVGTPYKITTCGNIPVIGITTSPVYDPVTGAVYLVAQEMVNGHPRWYVRGLDPATGAFKMTVLISGSPTNDSRLKFSAPQQLARPGLLLLDGSIYMAFGSHCDHKPYVGYVAGVNLATRAKTLWADESGLTGNQAGIWQSGGGLVSDGPGRIFFTSGNGVSPAPGPGTKPPGQLGDAVVRLNVNPVSGTLSAADYFSPVNAPTLDAADEDLGSGAPVGLPFGTTTYPDLIAQAGHDGRFFVLNRDSLGGRKQGPNGTDAYLAKVGPYGGVWGHPAAFAGTTGLLPPGAAGSNDYAYNVGRNDDLRVLRFGASSTGKPTVADVANSTITIGPESSSPVVTSNGTTPSSALVWLVNRSAANLNGTLQAFRGASAATCTASAPCKLNPLFSASIGPAPRLFTPATSNNAVYVASISGVLYGFGLLPASTALAGPSATFSQTGVGSATTQDVSMTAKANVTVTGVSAVTTSSSTDSAASQFQVNPGQVTTTARGSTPVRVSFPVTLHKGDTLTAPVTFTPAGPGGVTGTLSFTTTSASLPSASAALAGDGIRPGLSASASSAQFAILGDLGQFVSWVPVGTSVLRNFTITNSGATPETITSVKPPQAPFAVTGVPAPGTVLQPGQSFVAQVAFAPAAAASYSDSLTVTASGGSATISLTGQGLPQRSKFQASPSSVNLGSVPVGKQAHVTITVSNVGNETSTMKGSSHLAAPFHATYAVPRQLPVNADNDLTLPITFTPKAKGHFTTSYRITWSDISGTHTLTIPISGYGI